MEKKRKEEKPLKGKIKFIFMKQKWEKGSDYVGILMAELCWTEMDNHACLLLSPPTPLLPFFLLSNLTPASNTPNFSFHKL